MLWLHDRIGNAAPLFMVLLGILSFVNYARGQGVDAGMVGAIIIGELLIMVQAILGFAMLVMLGNIQARGIHILYGSVSVIFLPGLWLYTRGATDRRASLIWGVAGIFMMGLTLRAIGTAS